MTGIADLYLYLNRPNKDRRKRLLAHFVKKEQTTRFVVMSWKRTGSNLLCGILHFHPEICMHNELFNPIDIFTYHRHILRRLAVTNDDSEDHNSHQQQQQQWTVQIRDLYPEDFLEHIWNKQTIDMTMTVSAKKQGRICKAVGFKSFPEHWTMTRNEGTWKECILEDLRVKKVILWRRDELAVYISSERADLTGHYMTHSYPKDLKIHVDPAAFQAFVNNYRHTYRNKYRSPIAKRDTFWMEYEQLIDEDDFKKDVLPKLFNFLGVDPTVEVRRLQETVKQADPNEDLSTVISNYEELEFCFRHSDILHFENRRQKIPPVSPVTKLRAINDTDNYSSADENNLKTWSILLPVCSRPRASQVKMPKGTDVEAKKKLFNANRFTDLSVSSQHIHGKEDIDAEFHWNMLETFCRTLKQTMTEEQRKLTECIIGIDEDDKLFQGEEAKKRIQSMLPVKAVFINIPFRMYGHVCKIWNHLAGKAKNDFVVLLGGDIKLLDPRWQERIVSRFRLIAKREGLPFGAACVAMNDLSFPGFPTFPVIHRWHIEHFGALLPKQFSNQGGDPYLYELYSRFNAADFVVSCCLENTIGGDGDARYQKHQINWRGQILNMNLKKLKGFFGNREPTGVVLDIVIPSYRTNNLDFLERLVTLRASVNMYVKFWIVVDNPDSNHLISVKKLVDELNSKQLQLQGNYYINVLHYSENRGASYARNFGFNFSTADWILFLDDDVIPNEHLLDAYAGAIRRYPYAKVFVGLTELPEACNLWTQMLKACNVGYFYSISKSTVHPSWGVTANLMVRGSRHNSTIQFKEIYPKTGGGEDIDLVYQFKAWYDDAKGHRVTVGVPEAKVQHPWWNNGKSCYHQIMGWAWGVSWRR
jgi:hypothetical protein